MTSLGRRTLLAGLAGVGAGALAACGEDSDVAPPATDGSKRTDDARPVRLEYGGDPSQFAELTRPAGDPRGVVVLLHGGFWKAAYGLDLARPLAADLVGRGWAALNVEYRRVGGGRGGGSGGGGGAPETLDDVSAALDLLADPGLGLDTSRVVTLGHSAGGHLAAWAASRGRDERWAGGVDVTAVVSQAGVLDLVAAYEARLGSGAVEAFLGRPPGPGDAILDPQQQLPLDVPLWCVHGADDPIVPLSQSSRYVAAATAAGASAELVEVDGDHFTLIDTASPAWARTVGVLDSTP